MLQESEYQYQCVICGKMFSSKQIKHNLNFAYCPSCKEERKLQRYPELAAKEEQRKAEEKQEAFTAAAVMARNSKVSYGTYMQEREKEAMKGDLK